MERKSSIFRCYRFFTWRPSSKGDPWRLTLHKATPLTPWRCCHIVNKSKSSVFVSSRETISVTNCLLPVFFIPVAVLHCLHPALWELILTTCQLLSSSLTGCGPRIRISSLYCLLVFLQLYLLKKTTRTFIHLPF